MGWLSRLFGTSDKAAPPAPPARPVAPVRPVVAATPAPSAATAAPTPPARPANDSGEPPSPRATAVLTWLLACAAPTNAGLSASERKVLETLDATLALPELPDNLLPRAAALIPQLIALVRQTDLPGPAIAERVSKDTVLSAEVMRLASSPYYRAQGQVGNLEQAIGLIGLQGLQTVMARVLLKPIYRSAPGPLSARVGPRLWDHSEALARHTGILAAPAGQPVFDAYLAGLLHDTGWTVSLCVLDRANLGIDTPPSEAFVEQMNERVHRLFGLAAKRWDITPGFTALAQDARTHGVADGTHPLTLVLLAAERHSMDELARA